MYLRSFAMEATIAWNPDNESNLTGLAILCVSSGRQAGGVSHDAQESEITRYCREPGSSWSQAGARAWLNPGPPRAAGAGPKVPSGSRAVLEGGRSVGPAEAEGPGCGTVQRLPLEQAPPL